MAVAEKPQETPRRPTLRVADMTFEQAVLGEIDAGVTDRPTIMANIRKKYDREWLNRAILSYAERQIAQMINNVIEERDRHARTSIFRGQTEMTEKGQAYDVLDVWLDRPVWVPRIQAKKQRAFLSVEDHQSIVPWAEKYRDIYDRKIGLHNEWIRLQKRHKAETLEELDGDLILKTLRKFGDPDKEI